MIDWSMVDRGMVDNRSMGLAAGLCREGEGDLFTAWFTNDDLLLVNSVGSISKLGTIEALVLNLVLALNLGDLDGLGNTDLLGGRVGEHASDFQWDSDKGDLVSLSLVFLTAHLVFSMTISWRSIPSSSTSSHFHSFGLFFISNLGGGARSCYILPLVHIVKVIPAVLEERIIKKEVSHGHWNS